jgi:hypothetical protein
MKRKQRIEIHFENGRIEQAENLRRAQEVIRAHPEEAVEIWLVSANDLGIGSRVERLAEGELLARTG